MGGMGKTRLCIEVAHRTLSQFKGGTWYCQLNNAKTHADVVSEIARAMSLQLPPTNRFGRLRRVMSNRPRTLIILDAVEHLTNITKALIEDIQAECSNVSIMVTSRIALDVDNEVKIPIGQLGLAEGMQLFLNCAEDAQNTVQDDDESHFLVRSIVTNAQGHALAIQLAAGQIEHRSLRAIYEELEDEYHASIIDDRSDLSHDSSLISTVEWSWGLLNAAEKSTLSQLSVFKDGFTLDAAQAVVRVDAQITDNTSIETLIDRLIQNSLLNVNASDDEAPRYSMLSVIRGFALQQLGGHRKDTEMRHGAYYASEGALPLEYATWTGRGADICRSYRRSLSNLWSAAQRALNRNDAKTASIIAIHIAITQEDSQPGTEVYNLLDDCIQAATDAALILRLHLVRSRIVSKHDDGAFKKIVRQEAEAFAQSQGDSEALEIIGFHTSRFERRTQSREQTRTRYLKHLEAFRTLENVYYECTLLLALTTVAVDLDEAMRSFKEALLISEKIDIDGLIGTAHGNLANVCYHHGQLDEAKALTKHAVECAIRNGNRRLECLYRANLGNRYRTLGEANKAMTQYRRALNIAKTYGFLGEQSRISCRWAIAIGAKGARIKRCHFTRRVAA